MKPELHWLIATQVPQRRENENRVICPHVIITILYPYTSACMKSYQMLKGVMVHTKASTQAKERKHRVIYNSSLTLEAEAEASDAAEEAELVTSEAADLTDLVASEAA